MGDLARCGLFITEFNDEVIAKIGLKSNSIKDQFLNTDKHGYVRHYIVIECEDADGQPDNVALMIDFNGVIFDPLETDEINIMNLVEGLDLTEEEARQRLQKAGLMQ